MAKEKMYRVYVKTKGMKRFAPIGQDIEGNFGPVANLLCAYLYREKDIEKVLSEYKKLNPNHEWQMREAK